MISMFQGATLFNQDISGWNVSRVTTMQSMFQGASIFNQPIGTWNVSNVTNMNSMFYAASIFNQPLYSWNTTAVENMDYMFYNATLFNQDISGWNVSRVTPRPPTEFSNGYALTVENTPGGFFLTLAANGTTVKYIGNANDVPTSSPLFVRANIRGNTLEWFAVVKNGAKQAITEYAKGINSSPFIPPGQSSPVPFNNIVTTLMTDMSFLFFIAITFNENIISWDTSSVTDMRDMFLSAKAFNQPLNLWNVSSVTTMYQMFTGADAFNQDISGWNVSNVTNMQEMFAYVYAFNQPLNSWNVSKVTTMRAMFSLLNFDKPLNLWDVSAVKDMNSMFSGTTAFNQDISGWNVSSVEDMRTMFYGAIKFDKPLNLWNVSKVKDMQGMFNGASIFNQPLYSWNTSAVENMDYMFYNATLFNQDISGWNVSRVTPKPPSNFSTGSALTNIPIWLSVPPPSGLIARYPFDSNGNDISTNNNNLTNNNTVTFNTINYKQGSGAASFNGSNYFQIANDGRFSPDNFTVAFWIKPVSSNGFHQAIASCRNMSGNVVTGWLIYIDPASNLTFITGGGGSGFYGTGNIYTNFGGTVTTWVHVAITMTKSTRAVVLYINGSLYTTSEVGAYSNNTGSNLRIGAGANEEAAQFFMKNGSLLDDFRIYDSALSASQISAVVADLS
jgi:surface protein